MDEMEQLALFNWVCPNCGGVETWFDRSQTLVQHEDGSYEVLEDMCDRCSKCGIRVNTTKDT